MAKSQVLYFTAESNTKAVTFVNADSTTPKDLFVAGSNGSILKGISFCSNDTSSVNLQLFFYDGSTAYLIGTVRAVTLSGTDGAANAINALNPVAFPFTKVDTEGNRCIQLKSGEKIQCAPVAAVTTNKTVTVVAFGEDF